MRVEDGQLEAVVFEEPELRIDLEFEAVRRRGAVAAALVARRDAVLEHDEAARLVRRLVTRVRLELTAHRGGSYHHSVRCLDVSTSSHDQQSAARYFPPPSAGRP